jgi:hypothetical protein
MTPLFVKPRTSYESVSVCRATRRSAVRQQFALLYLRIFCVRKIQCLGANLEPRASNLPSTAADRYRNYRDPQVSAMSQPQQKAIPAAGMTAEDAFNTAAAEPPSAYLARGDPLMPKASVCP